MFSGSFNPQNASLAMPILVPVLALGFVGVFLFPIGFGAKTEEVVVTCKMRNPPANATESGDTITLSEAAKEELTTMVDACLVIGDDLASDTIENVNEKAYEMLDAFNALETETPRRNCGDLTKSTPKPSATTVIHSLGSPTSKRREPPTARSAKRLVT